MKQGTDFLRDRFELFWTSSTHPKAYKPSAEARYIATPLSTVVLLLVSGAPLAGIVLFSSIFKTTPIAGIVAVLVGTYLLSRLIEVLLLPVKIVPIASSDTSPSWRARAIALGMAVGVLALFSVSWLVVRR